METINAMTSHTISIFVANKPGVLVRVSQVFARRGFNIDSLVVSSGTDGRFSRMTVTSKGDGELIDQIIRQVIKLVDVLHAVEHRGDEVVEKELALIKVAVSLDKRGEVLQMVDHFKAVTVDFTEESLIIQVTGGSDKLDALIKMLERYGILEIVRTGKVAMTRGRSET